jgi:hypothetical protein
LKNLKGNYDNLEKANKEKIRKLKTELNNHSAVNKDDIYDEKNKYGIKLFNKELL